MQQIFRYGKDGKKLGMLDVILAKTNTSFNFKGHKDILYSVNIVYNKQYSFTILEEQKEILANTCKTKANLESVLGDVLEKLGFEGKDKKSALTHHEKVYIDLSSLNSDTLFESNSQEQEVNFDSVEQDEVSKKKSRKNLGDCTFTEILEAINEGSYRVKTEEHIPNPEEITDQELVEFFRYYTNFDNSLENTDNFNNYVRDPLIEEDLMDYGYFSEKTLQRIAKLKEGPQIIEALKGYGFLNTEILTTLLSATGEEHISFNDAIKDLLALGFGDEQQLREHIAYEKTGWDPLGRHMSPEDVDVEEYVSSFIDKVIKNKGNREYILEEDLLNDIMESVNKGSSTFYKAIIEDFYKKVDNVDTRKHLLNYLLKNDNLKNLVNVDKLIDFQHELILTNSPQIIDNSLSYALREKDYKSLGSIISAIEIILKKVNKKIDSESIDFNPVYEQLQDYNNSMLQTITQVSSDINTLDSTLDFGVFSKIKNFFKGGFQQINQVKKDKVKEFREKNQENQNTLKQLLVDVEEWKRNYSLLLVKVKKNSTIISNNIELLGTIESKLDSLISKLQDKKPELVNRVTEIKTSNIGNLRSHLDLFNQKNKINIESIDSLYSSMNSKLVPQIEALISGLKTKNSFIK